VYDENHEAVYGAPIYNESHPSCLRAVSELMSRITGRRVPIYGVRPKDKHLLGEGPWVYINTRLKLLEQEFRTNNYDGIVRQIVRDRTVSERRNWEWALELKKTKFDFRGGKLGDFIKDYLEPLSQETPGASAYLGNEFFNLLTLNFKLMKDKAAQQFEDFSKRLNEIKDFYPLTQTSKCYGITESKYHEALAEYVELVDQAKLQRKQRKSA
jgi:hypothetical protein